MGFSRAKESGDPNTVRAGVFQVSLDELIERPPDLSGNDELLDFEVEVAVVIGLDDSVDRAGYVL